jgi:hypothetical protein
VATVKIGTAIAAGLAMVSIVAGCGGSSAPKATPAASYVGMVCTAATDYAHQIKTLTSSVQSKAAANGSNPVAAKSDFVSFVEQFFSYSKQLTSRINAAGTPAVTGGAQIRTASLNALNQLDGEISDAREKAQALSTADPSQMREQAQEIGSQLSADTVAAKAQLTGHQALGVSQLDAAAHNNPSCLSLQNSKTP